MTLENAAADFANFAKNVKLPFDTNGSSNAAQAVSALARCTADYRDDANKRLLAVDLERRLVLGSIGGLGGRAGAGGVPRIPFL